MTQASFRLIFVAGSMRSGTTLLQQLLCTSPAANPFVHGCRYLVSHLGVYANYAGADRLYVDDYLGGPKGLFDFTKELLDRLLRETHTRLGQPEALVLKSPELSTYFPHAADLFPEARFVISVRDPKDTIASMIEVGERHRRSGVNSFLAAAGRNIDALSKSYRQFYLPVMQTMGRNQNGLRSRVLFVRYEDLVGDTESEARRLSKFCGLALHPAALAKRNADARGTRSIIDHQHWGAYLTALSGGPVSSTSVGRHREVLEPAEAQQIDRLCADVWQTLGYDQSEQRP